MNPLPRTTVFIDLTIHNEYHPLLRDKLEMRAVATQGKVSNNTRSNAKRRCELIISERNDGPNKKQNISDKSSSSHTNDSNNNKTNDAIPPNLISISSKLNELDNNGNNDSKSVNNIEVRHPINSVSINNNNFTFTTALDRMDQSKDIPRPNTRLNDRKTKNEKNKNDKNARYSKNPIYNNIETEMIERIMNEILVPQSNTQWSDISGLGEVKQALYEMVILPNLKPKLFTGLREPPRGLLLFGPPGNGKTMIAKAVASKANLTFFAISASSLTSKWMGDGEKMVKALFAVARDMQPSFIFIDEIDSILTSRDSKEHESSRRLKTEFLLQFDGATSRKDDRITVMGATNRPQDLDEAARRRLTKRIYVPLPEQIARKALISNLIQRERNNICDNDLTKLSEYTVGFSGNDLSNLCCDASMGPLRDKDINIEEISLESIRPISMKDFQDSLKKIKPSVSQEECLHFEEWNQKFGSSSM